MPSADTVEIELPEIVDVTDLAAGVDASVTYPVGAPHPDDMNLAVLVLRLTDQVKRSIRDVGDELGLSPAQLDVLRQLYSRGPTPMRRLAEILNCEASNLTGLVDKLETRGFVERQADPADRRVRRLALTDEGRRLSHETWFAVTRRCPFMNLPAEKRAIVNGLLREALLPTASGDSGG